LLRQSRFFSSVRRDEGLSKEKDVSVQPGTRRATRLLRECGKARKILSANDQTEIVLECFDEKERDFQFILTRAEFDADCAALKAGYMQLISDALAASSLSAAQLETVELIGA
jgi:molecular chaperone DnaK (HSP70)